MISQPFTLSGEMTFLTVKSDRARLLDYCKSLRGLTLSLNLGAVTHCDSAGLAFLIEAKRLARKYKKTCRIEQMPDSVKALAEFCGVEKILTSDGV
ncbi:lipid asymmetry maintenance protein MlaB [Legionella dresdenensis]|uniref:Lipid asymmetry maintenance protein MlaB n=1 Tax=Legionella dresdenensis TaxID=450200 RepID=A0ABV8CHP4_9GAMM